MKLSTFRATALAALLAASFSAQAGAPMAKNQPGYYRMMLGDFEITALHDGIFALKPTELLKDTTAEHVRGALAHAFLQEPVDTSVTGYLINTGSKLVLVDTGTGGTGVTGNLLKHLKAAGYTPEQVDEIYITHMHGDHVGGVIADGKAAFPNAVLRIDQHDIDHWVTNAAPEKSGAKWTDAYAKTGKLKPFEADKGDTELVPGVKAHAAHGHTPGHTTYVVESKGQKLVLWGDLMHVAAVQFPQPEITISFDSDNAAARAQRAKAYAEAAKEGYIVGATHLSFPGLGRLRAEGKGYVFVPVNYSVPK